MCYRRNHARELIGGAPRDRPAVLPIPDFADLHQQRQRHPHLAQQLLWEEYRQANPDGYRYSRFCELYQRWRRKQDVVPRIATQYARRF
jgi:transposase